MSSCLFFFPIFFFFVPGGFSSEPILQSFQVQPSSSCAGVRSRQREHAMRCVLMQPYFFFFVLYYTTPLWASSISLSLRTSITTVGVCLNKSSNLAEAKDSASGSLPTRACSQFLPSSTHTTHTHTGFCCCYSTPLGCHHPLVFFFS